MLKRLIHSTRWRFILCVIITNLLSIVVTMFVWLPLSQNLFPARTALAPYIPMGIATLAAIPISSAISLHSAKPIQDMVEATKSISKGDFSVRVSEEWEGDIGELLHSFNQMTAELGSTELMRNDFINIFSHEFKTPIVSIRGFAKRLRSGHLTQQQREEYLQFIAEESERLSNLANSILLIAKYENQALIVEQTEYDLDEQIRTCISLLRVRLLQSAIYTAQFDKATIYRDLAKIIRRADWVITALCTFSASASESDSRTDSLMKCTCACSIVRKEKIRLFSSIQTVFIRADLFSIAIKLPFLPGLFGLLLLYAGLNFNLVNCTLFLDVVCCLLSEWWVCNFILPEVCKTCLFVSILYFLNLFSLPLEKGLLRLQR